MSLTLKKSRYGSQVGRLVIGGKRFSSIAPNNKSARKAVYLLAGVK